MHARFLLVIKIYTTNILIVTACAVFNNYGKRYNEDYIHITRHTQRYVYFCFPVFHHPNLHTREKMVLL